MKVGRIFRTRHKVSEWERVRLGTYLWALWVAERVVRLTGSSDCDNLHSSQLLAHSKIVIFLLFLVRCHDFIILLLFNDHIF